MKKIIDFKDNRGVMSLIVILGIGLFVLAIGLTLTGQIVVEIMRNRNTIAGDQSFFTAEAAVREGIYQHINYGFEGTDNFPLLLNDISTSSISFEVTTSTLGWAYREAKGDAQNANYRKVRNTILLYPSALAFDYAVYSNKALKFGGVGPPSANAISIQNGGKVFSNDKMTCAGLTFGDNVAFSSDPTSGCDSNLAQEVPPPVFNPDYFGIDAKVCPSAGDNPCFSQPPLCGAIIVNNSIDQTNLNINLNGNLIVKGNFNVGGNSDIEISSFNNYPALFIDGDLTIGGTSDLSVVGIIYVTGKIKIAGDVDVAGLIISVGDTGEDKISGSVTVTYNSLTNPPVGFTDPEDPQIIGWQQE